VPDNGIPFASQTNVTIPFRTNKFHLPQFKLTALLRCRFLCFAKYWNGF